MITNNDYKIYNGTCTKIIEFDSNIYKFLYFDHGKVRIYALKTKYGPLPQETIKFLLKEWDTFIFKQFKAEIDHKEIESFCKDTFHTHVEKYIDSYIVLPTKKELNVLKNSKQAVTKPYNKIDAYGSITLMPCPSSLQMIMPIIKNAETKLMVDQVDTQIDVLYFEKRDIIRMHNLKNEKENEK